MSADALLVDLDPEVAGAWSAARMARSLVEPRFVEIADLCMPWRATAFTGDGQREPVALYDHTGLVSVEELVSRLVSGIAPDGVHYASLDDAGRAEDPLRSEALDIAEEILFRRLEQAFVSDAFAGAIRDLVAFGTACVRVERSRLVQPLHVSVVPLQHVYLTPGSGSEIRALHIAWPLLRADAERQFPVLREAGTSRQPDDRVTVIESWMRDPAVSADRWRQCFHIGGSRKLGDATEHTIPPYVVARWSVSPGEVWGIGRGQVALPAMRTVNEAMRMILAHAEMALAGMWQAEDDGVLNPYTIRLEPGAIVPIAAGSRGLLPLQPAAADVRLGQLVLDDHRTSIRQAFYAETITTRTSDTPPTALEIQQRMRELARQIGPAFAHLWRELVGPVLQRCIGILAEVGDLPRPTAALARQMRLVPKGTLVTAQKADDMRRALELGSAVASLYGQPAVATWMPAGRFVAFAADALDVPPGVVASEAEVAAQAQQAGEIAGNVAREAPEQMPLLGQLGQLAVGGGA